MYGPGKQDVHSDKRDVSPLSPASFSLLMTYLFDLGTCASPWSSHNSLGKPAKGLSMRGLNHNVILFSVSC